MNFSEPGPAPERFRGAFISANTFELIGARPVLGRDFHADDDRYGATVVRRTRTSSACLIPGGRAMRLNRVEALRAE